MKKLLLFFLGCLFFYSGLSQEPMKPLVITKVVPCEGHSAKELYNLSKQWLLNVYHAPDKVIQIDEPDNNYIGCSAVEDFSFMSGLSGTIRYNLIIETRDGRLRLQLKNIIHKSSNGDDGQWCNIGPICDHVKPFTKGLNHGQKNRANAKVVNSFKAKGEACAISIQNYIYSASSDANDDW